MQIQEWASERARDSAACIALLDAAGASASPQIARLREALQQQVKEAEALAEDAAQEARRALRGRSAAEVSKHLRVSAQSVTVFPRVVFHDSSRRLVPGAITAEK